MKTKSISSAAALLLEPSELSRQQQVQMLYLMHRYYENVHDETFFVDLHRKDRVVLLEDEGNVVGFTSYASHVVDTEGGHAYALFSGDTIVDRAYWGMMLLEKAWLRYAFELANKHTDAEMYWFLLCKGYRTFRFLPVHFINYHAGPCTGNSLLEKRLCAFATNAFGGRFDPERGLLYLENNYNLRQGIADISERERRHASIATFEQLNPHWQEGVELATLVPVSYENLKPIGRRWHRSAHNECVAS